MHSLVELKIMFQRKFNSLMWKDGRAGVMKITVAFYNCFSNRPDMCYLISKSLNYFCVEQNLPLAEVSRTSTVKRPRKHAHTYTHIHTRKVSSEPVFSPSQRSLPTQHITNTKYKRPCPQRDVKPRPHKSTGRRPTYYTERPSESGQIFHYLQRNLNYPQKLERASCNDMFMVYLMT